MFDDMCKIKLVSRLVVMKSLLIMAQIEVKRKCMKAEKNSKMSRRAMITDDIIF